jgi:hypothetical protein
MDLAEPERNNFEEGNSPWPRIQLNLYLNRVINALLISKDHFLVLGKKNNFLKLVLYKISTQNMIKEIVLGVSYPQDHCIMRRKRATCVEVLAAVQKIRYQASDHYLHIVILPSLHILRVIKVFGNMMTTMQIGESLGFSALQKPGSRATHSCFVSLVSVFNSKMVAQILTTSYLKT